MCFFFSLVLEPLKKAVKSFRTAAVNLEQIISSSDVVNNS